MNSILEFAAWRPKASILPTQDDRMLRRIGYWKASLRDDFPVPQELRAEYSSEVAGDLATYLESGRLFESYLGSSWCRFGCPGWYGSAEFTDGVWLWPGGLAHYVRHHGVALPTEFVRHATSVEFRARAFRWPPALVQRADDSYWIGWARSFRASDLETLLREARTAASRSCELMLEAAGVEHTTRLGMGSGTCITAACTRQVVGNTVFCGRCLAERDRRSVQMDADFFELTKILRLLSSALADQLPLRSQLKDSEVQGDERT